MAAAMPASDAGMRRMVTDNSVMSFTPGEIADARCDALLAMIEDERGARKQEVQEIHKMLLEVFAKLQNSTASDNRKSIFVHDKEQVCKEAESSMCEHGDLDNRFAELESLCKSLKSELEHFVKCEAEERFHQLDRMLAEWRQDQQTSKMEGRTSGEKLEDQMRHLSPGRVSSPQAFHSVQDSLDLPGKQANLPRSGVIFPQLDMLLPEQAEMDGGLGVGLLEEAFRSPAEENVGPAHTVEWDHSLAELTHASRSPIPGKVREAFGRARQRANCGLFAEGLAWASSDDVLYLWDYSDMSPSVHSVPGDSAIITVALCPAKSGIFETQQPRWVLVIATRLSVSLVGVNFARTQIRASSAPDAIPANVSLSDWTSSARAGIPGVPVNSIQSQSSLHFVPLQGFRALCEGALFHSIHSSPGGRIFLLSGAPHIYELVCSHGWYRAKCRLVRHSVGPGWWKSPKPGRLRLLSCGPAGHILTCDDVGTLRLCCVMDQIGGSSTLEELASLSAAALRDQVRAITQGSLASFTLTHLFCWMGATGQLLLDATTIAGERLHFVCSVEGSTRRKYGFWLQHLASSWSSSSSCPESHESRSVRISCLEEHPDPCFFAPGADGASTLGSVWLCAALRRAGASASDLAVSVRLNGVPHDFQPLSPNQAVEMQGMLSFDAPVLAIAQEESQPTCQKFAVLLADRVQTVTITHQASAAKRAPAEAAECCLFLQSLTSGAASGGVTGSRIQYDWCWSLDDARFPTFEEQRRAQLLNQAVPKMILGRWPSGLLRFLSETLRSVWTRPVLLAPARVVEVPSLPLSLCRKRRRCASPPIVAISELAAKKIFSQLQPVIQFVAKGLAHNAEEQVPFGTPCSAAMRAQLYVKRTEDAHAPSSCDSAQGRVRRAMLDLLDVMDRTRQVLGLIIILHKSGCTQAVLDSAPLQEHEPATASQGAAEPADVLLPTAAALLLSRSLRDLALSPSALWPAVQLCTALVLQAVQGNADDSPEQEGFGRSAVGLPHQSEADSICKELQDGCAQSPATVHAVESWVIAAVLAQYMDRVLCLATRTVQSMADQSIPPAELKQRRNSLNESRLKTARLSVSGTSHTPRPERSQGRTKRQLDKRPVLRLLAELAPALKEERSTADSASDVSWLCLSIHLRLPWHL
eukprot:s4553_g1.t2